MYVWPVAIAALVIAASHRSRVAGPAVPNIDKYAHFAVYGLIGTLVCRTRSGWKGAVIGLAAASAFGVTDEWHQSFVPGRSPDVMDWVADTLGAALAVTLYAGWPLYRRVLEWPLWPWGGRRVEDEGGAPSS
ncbi:MAG: VanZ family protein [Verrucomicrobiota bacterium]